ncbi:altronate dehydratase family protein [uncultured Mucilaginibacter sp.]|uniref:UxaA family hydrolase n=1 Tax=uncultured Mucilaginibacter sp. TaxID=797541 RepID=UPI0025F5B050|nr:altronate dehydratase family protein [uncultured Mucilaginibacter sp.]
MDEHRSTDRPAYLQLHRDDNAWIALKDLKAGMQIDHEMAKITLSTEIPAKHKFTIQDLNTDDEIYMYGVLVAKAAVPIKQGDLLTIDNVYHAAKSFELGTRNTLWDKPAISEFENRTFMGFYRSDGSVGTANHWLVIPLVFCENRNVNVLKEALYAKLGFEKPKGYEQEVDSLIRMYKNGMPVQDILSANFHSNSSTPAETERLFANIDGIKFLNHELGCGGTRADSDALCGLLAGYITHPNVAGATVLSLGCQHAQASILREEIQKRDPGFNKPLIVLEQQQIGTESKLMEEALKQTFAGLIQANQQERQPAPLSKLCIGLECGGSDGFSGISANPALGYLSDMLVSLGGSVILAEFPELCGVEQELSDRCLDEPLADRFMQLMRDYNAQAEAAGSGFYANPSPGNIRDGLITDAIKSAGAAKKGGSSPVVDVLDYPEKVTHAGLNLLCTPGSDVESTTAEVAAGANIVLFTTGLGTPTGNPVAPVVKLSTNTNLYQRMPDIIDIDCGTIIDGQESIPETAHRILNYVIDVASGRTRPKAVMLGQDDFIPWKRGVSL